MNPPCLPLPLLGLLTCLYVHSKAPLFAPYDLFAPYGWTRTRAHHVLLPSQQASPVCALLEPRSPPLSTSHLSISRASTFTAGHLCAPLIDSGLSRASTFTKRPFCSPPIDLRLSRVSTFTARPLCMPILEPLMDLSLLARPRKDSGLSRAATFTARGSLCSPPTRAYHVLLPLQQDSSVCSLPI